MAQNKPTIVEVNCADGTEIVREMTDAEYSNYLADVERLAQENIE